MKRSFSSINNNRDISLSQSKRIREDALMREEEEELVQHMIDDPIGFSSQKKVVKVRSKNPKEKTSLDGINNETYPNITTHTPSGSSISFSSSSSSKAAPSLSENKLPSSKNTSSSSKGTLPSSKGTLPSSKGISSSSKGTLSSSKGTLSSSNATSSSSNDTSSSSNDTSSSSNDKSSSKQFNKTSRHEANPSSQLQEKGHCAADGIANISDSENNSMKKVSVKEKKKSTSSNKSSTDLFNRTTGDSYSKVVVAPLSNNTNQTTTVRNSSRCSTVNHLSEVDQASSSSSILLNDSNSSNKSIFPIQSLVEGTLEYREMKRMYLKEQENAEEWRKDYQVLKQQLVYLKSTTIPRPTAEVMEWLQELFDLMNTNGDFKGDERTLNKIAKDLGLDKTSLITVSARTPQKSSLKLFRLLYPTVSSRARCGSISTVSKQTLENIYLYVRNLHKNLNFSRNDMRKAIGTSIRSAISKLRKLERFRQAELDALQDENVDPDEPTNAESDTENALDGTEDVTDDDGEKEEDNHDEVENEDDDEGEDGGDVNDLMIDDEFDEDDE